MNRRDFIKASTIAGAGALILPRTALGAKGPNNKLNIALIGVWGRALAHYDVLAEENVVALCDINEKRFPEALKRFPNAKTYVDWRKALDQKDLDAVVICTADHHHAFIANWALNRDLHVYCEKPLAISVEEARIVRANWMKKKTKLATQVGMQRHAIENFNRVKELIRDGAIGNLTDAYAWGNRQIRRAGYLPAQGTPPEGFHFDQWLGPSPDHPYNPDYFSGGPGMNCLQWNMFWDFGAGQVGDMGSHTMDLLWNAVDATLPTSAEAKGEKFNPDVTPVECESHWEHPANDWRGPINVSWYQGGVMPGSPRPYVDLKAIDHGAMFKGSKGFIIANFDTRIVLPVSDSADLTYYKPRTKETLLPPVGHFQRQWINACKNPSLKTACDFEYSGNMIEQMLLGLVAYRVGKKIEYNPATGQVTNSPEANALLSRKYRDGWTLNG
ncbi:MAG: Gfo/Idh/MocA family oxidoreductase [Abitibacteriaceae bacterium]|nr:Gfo/Idh/MocA family oxidoreductase [Abditibacteriaceae bacterium]MBV9864127.1 Gfo/Idh/MocA family oxidoreductase [Abditibacteriaceae bacterium]